MEITSGLNKKGFFSIDALFAVILLLVIIGGLVNLYEGRAEMAQGTRSELQGKMITEKMAAAVNTVYASDNVLKLNFDLTENILGEGYNFEFDSDQRVISLRYSDKDDASTYVRSSVVTGNVEFDNDLVISDSIEVKWVGDKIVVSNP